MENLFANPYAGDGTIHLDMHLIYIDELCGLFKLAGLSEDGVKNIVFPLSFKGRALALEPIKAEISSKNLSYALGSP
jgi:hypothetical protein